VAFWWRNEASGPSYPMLWPKLNGLEVFMLLVKTLADDEEFILTSSRPLIRALIH
jgi:hypothetical protein